MTPNSHIQAKSTPRGPKDKPQPKRTTAVFDRWVDQNESQHGPVKILWANGKRVEEKQ